MKRRTVTIRATLIPGIHAEMSDTTLALLLPLAFMVGIPLMWCLISYLIAFVGGWQALARSYTTIEKPRGK